MTIGDRIKNSREAKGLSSSELAKKLKISKQLMYKYENNIITNIPSDKVEKIAALLDISPAYLMGWFNDKIGKRIRSRREELGMTQEELASILGYKSKSTITKIESGVNDITQSKVLEFASALKTSAAYLMGWENNLTANNAELIPDIMSDIVLLEYIKMLMNLNIEHRQTIYNNIEYLHEKEKVVN